MSQHTGANNSYTKDRAVSHYNNTSNNAKAWTVPVIKHIDASKNTKAWAVSQHTDAGNNTKATPECCYVLHSYMGDYLQP